MKLYLLTKILVLIYIQRLRDGTVFLALDKCIPLQMTEGLAPPGQSENDGTTDHNTIADAAAGHGSIQLRMALL